MTGHGDRERLLRELGALVGIERAYRDNSGRRVVASTRAIAGILGALGWPVGSSAGLVDAVAEHRARDRARPVPPVIVVGAARGGAIEFGALPEHAARTAAIHLTDESGRSETIPIARVRVDAPSGDRVIVDLGRLRLPIGYYALILEGGARPGYAQLLVRPGRARRPARAFGLFAPVYGLRSGSDWGIGSTSELARLGRWAGARGASFLGTLPLYPAYYDEPFEASPYRPVSRIGWNEIYLDVEALPELAVAPEAASLLRTRRTRRAVVALRAADSVDYVATYREKRAVIERCARAVEHGPRADAYAAFCAAHPEIEAYAAFRAAREGGSADDLRRALRYHRYAQFATDAALGSVAESGGIPLYLDLPLGVHPSGFDPVHFSSSFVHGASVGAPPDDFFVGGQNWGIPPLDPEGLRRDRFAYVIASVRHLVRHASVVRIDHVMGLQRCFVIPDGLDATDGAYLRYPSSALRAIVAIEATRAGTTVVGEDLGTVPTATRRAMRADGILRSAVYEIEATAERAEPVTTPDSMASFGTHDLPRFAEFVVGADLGRRVASGALTRTEAAEEHAARRALRARLDEHGDVEHGDGEHGDGDGDVEPGIARAYRGVLGWLGSSASDLALVDLGDLLLDPEPENRPGPESGATSWRHRMVLGLDALEETAAVDERLALVARGRPGGERAAGPTMAGVARDG
jgi:4-alpha-glucanotransferase